MDAVKFLQERSRMYESGAATPSVRLGDVYNPERAVKIVEEWSAAHPRKTRQGVFLEQYPEARLDKFGVIQLCPMSISATRRDSNGECTTPEIMCMDCRREFWTQEVE
nr:MAG TPA: hypothetical protein [Bacteriophage sp.]